jgi:hypothetical protein
MKNLIALTKRFSSKGIQSIKLRNLLEIRDPAYETREIKTMFPPVEIGSITLVDQVTLLVLIELINPERILEIGTYQGYTTKLFAINSTAKEIISVDLPQLKPNSFGEFDNDKILVDGNYNDEYLRHIQNITGTKYLRDLCETDMERVRLIKCDSTKLDYDQHVGLIQFAFIDGGHTYEIVKNDTENVLKKIKSGVIVWHDYNSTIHSGVTSFLEEYSQANQIFYVQGGICAFQVLESL